MSTWRDELYARLAGDSTLTNLVPADSMAPVRNAQGVDYPRVRWVEVAGIPEVVLDGATDRGQVRLQLDVLTLDYDAGIAIKDRIRTLMNAPGTLFDLPTCLSDADGPDDSFEVFHRILEFSLWVRDG